MSTTPLTTRKPTVMLLSGDVIIGKDGTRFTVERVNMNPDMNAAVPVIVTDKLDFRSRPGRHWDVESRAVDYPLGTIIRMGGTGNHRYVKMSECWHRLDRMSFLSDNEVNQHINFYGAVVEYKPSV